MDIQPQSTQPISDDQELAKVLAGVSAESDETSSDATPAMSEIAAPIAPGTPPPAMPAADDAAVVESPAVEPALPAMPEPVVPMPLAPAGDLDAVLVAPNASTQKTIFSRACATTAGAFRSDANLAGTYTF